MTDDAFDQLMSETPAGRLAAYGSRCLREAWEARAHRVLDESTARAMGREIGAVVVGEISAGSAFPEVAVRKAAFEIVGRHIRGAADAPN